MAVWIPPIPPPPGIPPGPEAQQMDILPGLQLALQQMENDRRAKQAEERMAFEQRQAALQNTRSDKQLGISQGYLDLGKQDRMAADQRRKAETDALRQKEIDDAWAAYMIAQRSGNASLVAEAGARLSRLGLQKDVDLGYGTPSDVQGDTDMATPIEEGSSEPVVPPLGMVGPEQTGVEDVKLEEEDDPTAIRYPWSSDEEVASFSSNNFGRGEGGADIPEWVPEGEEQTYVDLMRDSGADPELRQDIFREWQMAGKNAAPSGARADAEAAGVIRPGEDVEVFGEEQTDPAEPFDPYQDSPDPLVPGNTPTSGRKELRNRDGSVSTVSSISFEEDGQEILIPTVVNGKRLSDQEAIDLYHRTGKHLGIFGSPESATAAGQGLHEQQAREHAQSGQTFRDPRTGQSYEAPGISSGANPSLVRESLSSLVEQAPSDEHKAAAEQAIQMAERIAGGPDVTFEEAIEYGIAHYEKRANALDQRGLQEMRTRNRGGGTGGAPNKWAYKLDKDKIDKLDQYIEQTQSVFNVKAMNDSGTALAQLETAARQGTGVADTQAVVQMIRTTQDRISDQDMRQALQSGGLWAEMKNLAGYTADGGKKDEQYMKDVQALARAAQGVVAQRKREAAEFARNRVQSNPFFTPEEKESGTQYVYDTIGFSGGGGGGGPKKPTGGDSADELINKF